MQAVISRRKFLAGSVVASGALALDAQVPSKMVGGSGDGAFRLALNAATIRGYKLPLVEQMALAAKAGYEGFEPWVADIEAAVKSGTPVNELRKRREDAGLAVVSAIAFANWLSDDEATRARGMEQMKRDMDLLAQLGGTHIAASPAGVNQQGLTLDLERASERYHAVLELGRAMRVTPQLEFWGASANLSRLDQCIYVAARTGHPDACILADAYHMYRGGSHPAALRLLGRQALHCFHINDYPATPTREELQDSDRIWPGDGIAPFKEIFAAFKANQATPWLSIEIFNAAYWQAPALATASTGLAKMKAVVAAHG